MYSKTDWVAELLRKCNYNRKDANEHYQEFNEVHNCNWNKHAFTTLVHKVYHKMLESNEIADTEIDDELIRLEANKQKQQDKNNYLRKVNRESFRQYSSLETSYNNYVEALKQIDLSKFEITSHPKPEKSKTAILQVTDTHFNTLLIKNDSLGNEYNFEIASKRFKKFITESIRQFEAENVSDVYFCMTGDLISSSRRLQEVLCQNTSLCLASVIATKIIMQGILELSSRFNVFVSFCVGNESRLNQDNFSGANILASENFDFLIYHSLKLLLSDKGIHFIDPENLIKPLIPIQLPGRQFNLILTHGNFLKCSERDYTTLSSQYLNQGQKIDLIICGHFHHVALYEKIVFCGSMIGQTEYSCNLGFNTRPSQNIYILDNSGDVSPRIIYLDDVTGIKGYEFEKSVSDFAYLDKTPAYNNTVTIRNLC